MSCFYYGLAAHKIGLVGTMPGASAKIGSRVGIASMEFSYSRLITFADCVPSAFAARQLKNLLAMPAVDLIKIPYSSSKSMHGGMCATLCRPQN